MRRAGLIGSRGDLHRVGQRVDRPIGQRLVEPAEPTPQSSLSHEDPSPLRVGARHYVTMTSPSPELQQTANPAPRPPHGRHAARHGRPALRGAQAVRRRSSPRSCPAARGSTPTPRASPSWRPARCCWRRRHAAARRAGRGGAVRRRCSRPTSTWSGCGRTSRCSCGIGAIARLPLQIPMITEALKIYRAV